MLVAISELFREKGVLFSVARIDIVDNSHFLFLDLSFIYKTSWSEINKLGNFYVSYLMLFIAILLLCFGLLKSVIKHDISSKYLDNNISSLCLLGQILLN